MATGGRNTPRDAGERSQAVACGATSRQVATTRRAARDVSRPVGHGRSRNGTRPDGGREARGGAAPRLPSAPGGRNTPPNADERSQAVVYGTTSRQVATTRRAARDVSRPVSDGRRPRRALTG